jgi:predicted regulator of Ras-like GTPase activity (Roadblock/LC7/MglB family)
MDPYARIGDNPNIQGWILLSKEGLPIYSVLPIDTNDVLVSAISAAILSVSKRAVKELARGDLKRILIEGNEGIIILSEAGPNYILCTLAKSGASLGMVFLSIQNKIDKILSGDFDDKDDKNGSK